MKEHTLKLEICRDFSDFELIDSGEGRRLERWGKTILDRPDPQAIWKKNLERHQWSNADAVFRKNWEIINPEKVAQPWTIEWRDVKLALKLSPFKHTGVFAEQSANWKWLSECANKQKNLDHKPKVLNLFGYTGAATMVLSKMGCMVTHVDASKQSINWAKENQKINGLPEDSVRWILDDCVKFVKREIKRGAVYDGIIMDPPAFGHSPNGKTWKFSEDFPKLLEDSLMILDNERGFLLVNAYAVNMSAVGLKNILESAIQEKKSHQLEAGELCIEERSGRLLSTGIYARLNV